MENYENKNLWVEEIKYSQTKPRCSLDMLITLSGGGIIDDSIMRLPSFSGSEEISQPYTYKLEVNPTTTISCAGLVFQG